MHEITLLKAPSPIVIQVLVLIMTTSTHDSDPVPSNSRLPLAVTKPILIPSLDSNYIFQTPPSVLVPDGL